MALGVGSIVTQKVASADLPENLEGPDVLAQPPQYGKVVAVGSPGWNVLWQQGVLQTNMAATVFDDLYAVSANSRAAYLGQVVRVAGESPEYQYQVMSMFRRGAAVNAERASLKALNSRGYREVLVTQLVAVTGR
jgi:hypothetical protein